MKNKRKQDVLFGEAAEKWLAEVKETRKPATFVKYRTVYLLYLKGELENIPVRKIYREQISSRILRGDGRAPGEKRISQSTQKSIISVLNQIFAYAEQYYHTEPVRVACRGGRCERRPVEVLNRSQQARLFRFLYQEMNAEKLGIIICMSTGLRLGEICSLRWEDIDPENRVLHVNRTVQRIAVDGRDTRTALLEGPPKSLFSQREIPISEELIRLMRPYYGHGIYVLGPDRPMEPRTYQNRFHQYLECAGIDRKNFHILRHTFATNCIDSGADVKSLSEMLGHSDVKITLNRYVHPTLETKRQHLDSLSSVYRSYLRSAE